jgi:hypothetical protein
MWVFLMFLILYFFLNLVIQNELMNSMNQN